MKKIICLLLLTFCGITNAQVSFKPGLRAGLNLSHFTKSNEDYYYDSFSTNQNRDFSSKTDFYVGFYGALHLTKYYTLQPEFDYSRQGSKFKDINNTKEINLDVSYLSIAIVNKFTFSDKFNVHIGPTIDFQVENNFNTDSEVDLAFILGAGYNFTKNFGLEARVKKGVIPVLDYSDGNHSNVVFSFGGTYTFDLK